MSKNQINHASKSQHTASKSHKSNTLKTLAAAALISGFMIGEKVAAERINPDTISIDNPYIIKQSGQLLIEAGKPIRVKIPDNEDFELISYPSGQRQTNSTYGTPIIMDASKKKILINQVGGRNIYTTSGHFAMTVNYQADIIGPKGDRPDAVIVDPGETTKLTIGSNRNPTGSQQIGAKRKGLNDTSFETGSPTDTTKIKSAGQRVVRANDGRMRTNDTIAVVERPVANPTARRLDFSATVAGVTYKIYKAESIGTDTTWTEVPTLAFVGNGNPTSVNTGLGIFRVGAIRRTGTPEVKDDKNLVVDFGTDIYEVADKKPSFIINNGVLRRSENVEYYIYDISGKIIDSGYGLDGHIKSPGVYLVKSKKDDGSRETHKAMVK